MINGETDALISIIIPAYNVGPYIAECLDSVLDQSHQNFEVLVIDDGSTDATPIIVSRYRSLDARVKHIRVDWGGVSVARNRGIDLAVGEYLCFVDSDDLLHPEALSTLLSAATAYRAAAVRAEYARFRNERLEKVTRTEVSRLAHGVVMSSNRALRELAHGRVPTMVWAWLWHKSVFETLRFPPGRSHEDTILVAQAMAVSPRTVSIPDLVYYYRTRPGSFMQTLNPGRLDQIWAREETCSLLEARFTSPVIRARAQCGIVLGAALVMRAMHDANLPVQERRRWTADIYACVSRLAIVRVCLHPLATPGMRIQALLLLCGSRPNKCLWAILRPIVAWRARARRSANHGFEGAPRLGRSHQRPRLRHRSGGEAPSI